MFPVRPPTRHIDNLFLAMTLGQSVLATDRRHEGLSRLSMALVVHRAIARGDVYWLRARCHGALTAAVRRDVRIVKPAPTTVTGPLDFTVPNLQAEPETVAALAAIDWNRRFRRVCLDPERGLVTLMSPSRLHEELSAMLGDIVEVATDTLSGAERGIGSTRLRGGGDPPDTAVEPECAFHAGGRARAHSRAWREGEAKERGR
jgi:hypothetical protein